VPRTARHTAVKTGLATALFFCYSRHRTVRRGLLAEDHIELPCMREVIMLDKKRLLVVAAAIMLLAPLTAWSQVLGACGTPSEDSPAPAQDEGVMKISSVPLPGQRAINFELPAVVGDEIKTIKLSDYNGKWRVVCFYPADFTFV
jgi:peroxiredoxin (alkyl hydroperoxide reductase subunit C)